MKLFVEAQGHGPPLVLIHGWGFNGTVWDGLVPPLSRRWHTLNLDLPGFGRSPPSPDELSLDVLTDCLAEYTPEGAAWVGWSLGGLLAMNVARRHPRHVGRLSVIATTPRFPGTRDWPHAVPSARLRDFQATIATDPRDGLDRFTTLIASSGANAKAVARYLRERMFRFGEPEARALAAGLRLLMDTDLRHEGSAIACPALMVFGDRDPLIPAEALAPITALFPQISSAVIRGAAHAPFISHRQETLVILMEFLDAG